MTPADITARLTDIIEAYRPPWWRPLLRRRWKRTGRDQALANLARHLTGQAEPLRRYGVKTTDSTKGPKP